MLFWYVIIDIVLSCFSMIGISKIVFIWSMLLMSKLFKGIIGIINDVVVGRMGVWFMLWLCKLD